jgi:hypothetical protein
MDEPDITGYPLSDSEHGPSQEPDITGYPPSDGDSPESDITGYRPSEDDADHPAEDEEESPFWTHLGFASMDAYLDHVDAESRRNNGLPPRREPPSPALGELASTRARSGPRSISHRDASGETRQVGLRLAPADYERLLELARSYAMAPATMARMLVVRSVRAESDSPPADPPPADPRRRGASH